MKNARNILCALLVLLVVLISITIFRGFRNEIKVVVDGDEPAIKVCALVKVDQRVAGEVRKVVIEHGQHVAKCRLDKDAWRAMRQGVVRIPGQNFIDIRTDNATGPQLHSGDFIPTESELGHAAKKWSGNGLALIGLAAIVVAVAIARFLLARAVNHVIPVAGAVALALTAAYLVHPLVLPTVEKAYGKWGKADRPVVDKSTPQPFAPDTGLGKVRGAEKDFVRFVGTPVDAPRLGSFFFVFIVALPVATLLVAFVFRKLSNW
jgi:hypothetical protein